MSPSPPEFQKNPSARNTSWSQLVIKKYSCQASRNQKCLTPATAQTRLSQASTNQEIIHQAAKQRF